MFACLPDKTASYADSLNWVDFTIKSLLGMFIGEQAFKIAIAIRFNLVQVCPSVPSFVFAVSFIRFLNVHV